MSAPRRRIVVTGVGPVTPLGTGKETFWNALAAGKSGVMKLQAFPSDASCTRIAAEVRDFDPKLYVKQRKSLKVMARDIQLAVGAAQLAVEDAALDTTKLDPRRFGVNCGAGLIATDLNELGHPVAHSVNGTRKFDLKKWGAEGMEQLFPLWMLKYLPNMPACHISINYDAQGPNNSITAGEASSTLAMGEAYRVISRGSADLFLTGGADSKINPLSLVRLALLQRLSKRNDEPARASRPFEASRDGLVAGEGAGIIVFEALEHAVARGAKIYGEIVGFGASCHPKNPGVAIEKAISRALAEAGIEPSGVGHIIANGVSCLDDDRIEAYALERVFGDALRDIPLVAYKSYFGQLAAGVGSVELIAGLLSLENRVLPATLNYERPDGDLPPLRISSHSLECPSGPFVTYDLSHSGQCGALVVRPFVA